nr:hypothetical protein [Mycolicibacterium komanii]
MTDRASCHIRASASVMEMTDQTRVVAPAGRLRLVLRFTVADDRIAAITIDGDPHRLSHLHLGLLGR